MSIDDALFSRSKCYFFAGDRYVRVTRGDTGPGTVDPGYPAPITNWGWAGGCGAHDTGPVGSSHARCCFVANGIDAALYSHTKCYFFAGGRYVRVTRGDTGPGTVDPGYPAPITNWG